MRFLDTNIDLRLVFGLILFGMIIFSTGAYGQTPSELGYRFLPSKIVQNTDAVMQVYAKGTSIPRNIDNLIATSSDSSIIQISSVEKDQSGLITVVNIKALNPGITNIDLAAPGFASQEVPVTVYGDNKVPTKLLIKTTPNSFSTIGAEKGYIAVELANDAGTPIKARQDTSITLSTTDSNIVNLQNTELTIKTGEYFAIVQFEVKKDGTAQISASAASMATVSSAVTVGTVATPKTIQLYVFPKILNSQQNSYGYVVAQLQQGGIPVLATEDITLPVQVTNASGITMKNTSGENPTVSASAPIVIKKGSYWGYTQISVTAGTTGKWNVGLTAKGYLISPLVPITTTKGPLLDDHTAVLDLLPVLATGQKELIGVMHLEDDSISPPNPVTANNDLQIEVDSSDPNTLSIDKVKMDKGTGSALVFGKVGNTVPVQPALHVVTIGPPTVPQTYTSSVTVPTSNSLALVANPLVPAILTDNDFPLALYITKIGAIDYFQKDLYSFTSPKDIFQTESKTLPQGESIVLLNSKSLKAGSSTITVSAGDLVTTLSINSLSSKPATVSIAYPDKILSNFKNTFSIQLLDSQANPVFLEDDTQFKLVSSDPTILSVPDSVTIKKGSYYQLFDAEASKSGTTELAVLTSNLPLAKFNIGVTSLTPAISISSNDYVDRNVIFSATINAQYLGAHLNGMKVDWNVKGATIQNMDSVTDKDGNAKITLLSQDPKTIDLEASVSGGAFAVTTASKTINVNLPLGSTSSSNTPSNTTPNTTNTTAFSLFGVNPMLIVIPVAAAAAGGIIILKKKNMLDGITEKINFMEKISELKERITQSREK
ncbi:MAG TPA: hypothetical protein VGR54_07715 [Nitrosopumilaceae archaeon]|nr:hypothetical protein [Nitrosopumilaceae archaeon]